MAHKISKVYLDACCFIEAVSFDVGMHKIERQYDVLYTKAVLESVFDEKMEAYTSTLSVAECQCIKDANGNRFIGDDIKKSFNVVLLSGRFVYLVQDTPLIAMQARELIWTHGLKFSGSDAIHVASAIGAGCTEFLTYDEPVLKQSVALFDIFGLHVTHPRKTTKLPEGKDPFPQQGKLPFQLEREVGEVTTVPTKLFGGDVASARGETGTETPEAKRSKK